MVLIQIDLTSEEMKMIDMFAVENNITSKARTIEFILRQFFFEEVLMNQKH